MHFRRIISLLLKRKCGLDVDHIIDLNTKLALMPGDVGHEMGRMMQRFLFARDSL